MLSRDGGAIVFTSSFVGTSVGLPGMGAYAAAKAGLMGLVKSIAADYGARNIRANALLPGGTDTGMAAIRFRRIGPRPARDETHRPARRNRPGGAVSRKPGGKFRHRVCALCRWR